MDETMKVTFNAFDRDAEIEFSERNLPNWFQADAARKPRGDAAQASIAPPWSVLSLLLALGHRGRSATKNHD
jgi:hypothetical protein